MDTDTRNEIAELVLEALKHPENSNYIDLIKKYFDCVDESNSSDIPLSKLGIISKIEDLKPLLQSGLFRFILPDQRILSSQQNNNLMEIDLSRYNEQEILISLEPEILNDYNYLQLRVNSGYKIIQSLRQNPLPGEMDVIQAGVIKAAYLFNHGLYFETHEILEEIWLEEVGKVRLFLQGIIQIAVGFHHLFNGNYYGAVSLTKDGLDKIKPYSPVYYDMDIESFIKGVEICRSELGKLSRESVGEFDRTLVPKIKIMNKYCSET